MAIPKLMTIQEVMESLKVSRSTIYRLIDAGLLRRVKVGGASRITEESVMGYLGYVRRLQ